jgi:hypothetical protein
LNSQTKILYVIEEVGKGGVNSSKLLTTSPWLAIADFLIKVRISKKEGLACEVIPSVKTKDINHKVIFISAFLKNKKGEVIKEVRVITKAANGNENRFDRVCTNEYYLSSSYLEAIKGLVNHIKSFSSDSLVGLLSLATIASIDDNHLLWSLYSPHHISNQRGLGF